MEFRDNEAIYLQIAGYVSENILLEKWPLTEKIPSVRELAVELQVNPNTVVRTFEFLQQRDVISNKRGIGFFATENAIENIKSYKKERFMSQELPEFFRTIYLLNISLDDISNHYKEFIAKNY